VIFHGNWNLEFLGIPRLKSLTKPLCIARFCYCYYPGFSLLPLPYMGTNIHCECGRKNILSSILIMEVMEVIESKEEFNNSVGNLSEEGQVGVNTYGSPIAAQERAQDFV